MNQSLLIRAHPARMLTALTFALNIAACGGGSVFLTESPSLEGSGMVTQSSNISFSAAMVKETLTVTSPIVSVAQTIERKPDSVIVTETKISSLDTVTIRQTVKLSVLAPEDSFQYTKDVIVSYETSHPASNLCALNDLPFHIEPRARVDQRVESTSTSKTSNNGAVAWTLQRTKGDFVGLLGSFPMSDNMGWLLEQDDFSLCSSHTSPLLNAEFRHELFLMAIKPHGFRGFTPLHSKRDHGLIQQMWFQDNEAIKNNSDAFRPSTHVEKFGTARHVGGIQLMWNDPHGEFTIGDLVVFLTMTIELEMRPSINGQALHVHGNEISNDFHNAMETTVSNFTQASSILISGLIWSEEHKMFSKGNIECLIKCSVKTDSNSVWYASFIGPGADNANPLLLSFLSGSYNNLMNGKPNEQTSFITGDTAYYEAMLRQSQHGITRHSAGRALLTRLVYNVFDYRDINHSEHWFSPVKNNSRLSIIMSAATITANLIPATVQGESSTPLYVRPGYREYYYRKHIMPEYVWAGAGFESSDGRPYISGNATMHPPTAGSATYNGFAGGYYASGTNYGGFISTINLEVEFEMLGPSVHGSFDYNFGVVTGKLSITGGTWDENLASFGNGQISCFEGCVSVGVNSAWSANFISTKVPGRSRENSADGINGKIGVSGLSNGNKKGKYDLIGVFAAITDQSIHAAPSYDSYFPALVSDMIMVSVDADTNYNEHVSDHNTYNRRTMPDQLGRDILADFTRQLPYVVRDGDTFTREGGTIQLIAPSWDWRTGDVGNCNCTMFLTGSVFDSNGVELPMGLSANQKLMSRHLDYSDARSGWVAGVWTRSHSPDKWHQLGESRWGIFLDGSRYRSLPKTGTASYIGQVFGIATHSTYPEEVTIGILGDGYEILEGDVSLKVTWTANLPSISGRFTLFANDPFYALVTHALTRAYIYSAPRQSYSGNVRCGEYLCEHFESIDYGQWNAMLINTDNTAGFPGMVAGAYAITNGDLKGNPGRHRQEDIFGWFSARPPDIAHGKEVFLLSPGYSAQLAYQQGFARAFDLASQEERASGLTIDFSPEFAKDSEKSRFGFFSLHPRNETSRFMYTSFWTQRSSSGFSLGMDQNSSPVAIPNSGQAEYNGNVAGIFLSSEGSSGIFDGDVTLSVRFGSDGVRADGDLNLNFNGATSKLKMSVENKFVNYVDAGKLECTEGCNGGSMKWGGSFLNITESQPNDGIPNGFYGDIKLQGVTVSGNSYDALGMFAAVK